MPVRSTKETLKQVRVPIVYFVGKTDIAAPNALDDFERLESVPVFLGILDIPGDSHAGTFRQKNGGKFGVAGVAWLKWRLKNDHPHHAVVVAVDLEIVEHEAALRHVG
jgi:hypothetical protein